jgi:hypothetical protein
MHPSKCLYVRTFAIVEFLPHLLQHFRCDGLLSMIDSVPTGRCSPTFPSQCERFVQSGPSAMMDWTCCRWRCPLLRWPPQSPDISMLFLLVGVREGMLYVPPLPQSLQDQQNTISHAVQTITPEMLQRVWQEFNCCSDVWWVMKCAHIEAHWWMHMHVKYIRIWNPTILLGTACRKLLDSGFDMHSVQLARKCPIMNRMTVYAARPYWSWLSLLKQNHNTVQRATKNLLFYCGNIL